MKRPLVFITLVLTFISCQQKSKILVQATFIDSLLSHYKQPAFTRLNSDEIQFWKSRIDANNPGIVNESKYASALVSRFNLSGDINDVKIADSIVRKIDSLFGHKEAAPYLALTRHAILQHHFTEAYDYLQKAKTIGIKPYESFATSFDVDFELGYYNLAENDLKAIRSNSDYGYNFRRSKWEHYKGDLDSAIGAMTRAVELSGSNTYLKQAALSNTADLYIHNGELQKANNLYMESIYLDATDLHSIMGLGWIALVHDHNDSLAEKIFLFVHSKTKLPDPLFKLVQVAEKRGDSILQKKYAEEFVSQASDSAYGNMYNKYMIDLYTGILHDPAKANMIAGRELQNRSTPQTYAWYVWSLYINNKKEEAFRTYKQFVSGKPLEGLELYWMGKLMQGLNKGYNAQQFFEAANKNRYDLSPGKVNDIDNALTEK